VPSLKTDVDRNMAKRVRLPVGLVVAQFMDHRSELSQASVKIQESDD
jgi:hypothetical protein